MIIFSALDELCRDRLNNRHLPPDRNALGEAEARIPLQSAIIGQRALGLIGRLRGLHDFHGRTIRDRV
jgi:hypothetical protein